jgi:hypothetical protein
MRVGEALIREGLITRQQLDLALQRQVQFGGRIGTNFVELKILSEEELTKFLGRYFRVPPVLPEMLASLEEEVLSAVSTEIVEKYKILPFRKDRSRLHAAVLNPRDLKAIDELRFVTGYDIIPYVITELRLLYALEKYYGIKRELRYISVVDRFDPEAKVEVDSIDKIKAAFVAVGETEEIAGILIQAAYKIAERVAVFIIKGGKIAGWKARGLSVEGFSTTDKEISIFSDVLKRGSHYRGPVLNIKGNEALIKALSGTPQDALLMPITIRDKAVALFYVDNGNRSVLNANVGYLSKLAAMAGVAFEMMILRKKIMEM